MRKAAEAEKLPLEVTEGDVLGGGVALQSGHYRLAIVAEVVSHFRALGEVRTLFEKLADAMAPGGLVLVNSFLASDGYKPDTKREVACFCGRRFSRGPACSSSTSCSDAMINRCTISEKEHLPPRRGPRRRGFQPGRRGVA
jgi:hypothetical protein